MFKIIVEHIKCIKVCDLWKIVISTISVHVFWQIKFSLAIFVEAHYVSISAESFSILKIGFRQEGL